MDPARPPGDGNRGTAPPGQLSTDPLRGVRLERETELGSVVLRWRDWPGLDGPLVVLGASAFDPRGLAPRYRVIAIDLPDTRPYQSQAHDVAEFLHQFGLTNAVLLGVGVGAVIAEVCAAWFSHAVRGVLLCNASNDATGVLGRSLRDAPPHVRPDCPVRVVQTLDLQAIEAFLMQSC